MKPLAKEMGLRILYAFKARFTAHIQANYEHRAKPCATCEKKGACCLDAHFVNVHITRLEAAAINEVLKSLPVKRQRQVKKRIKETIQKYYLSETGDTFAQTYACPLFEKQTGCIVHGKAKPLPCIQHACYENKNELPPDALLENASAEVERLNKRVYGRQPVNWRPLPVAIMRESSTEDAA